MYHLKFIFPLTLILIVQLLIPIPMYANENIKIQNASQETAKISLESAIQIIKENFEISKDFTEFTSGFNNYDSRQIWSLNWSSTGQSGGSFASQVDAVSGEILNIYSWEAFKQSQYYELPKISREEAEKIAAGIVQKLTGPKYSQLKYVNENTIIPVNSQAQTVFSFRWQRIANGIPLQGDDANIQIDAKTGKVISWYINWNSVVLPEIDGIINTGKVMKSFTDSKLLELQYFLTPVYRPLTTENSRENVQLVYLMKYNGIIDAYTGKPLIPDPDQWVLTDGSMMGGMGSSENISKSAVPLTPQEQKEIEDNSKLISQEKAVEFVKQWVEIPSDYTLKSINLYKDSSLRDDKIWSFQWGTANQLQSIDARVNASNGELTGFSCYDSTQPGSEVESGQNAINREAAQAIAENFLKKIQPEKFLQTKLKADNVSSLEKSIPETESNLITFNYERFVNGVLFPSNQMTITINPVTKKITSYNLNWWDLNFPQLSQALSQTNAENLFLKARPLELQYIILYKGDTKEARLVYKPSTTSNQTSDLMDAKDGIFLNWEGKPLKEQISPCIFTDITGNFAEKEITALGLAGILGEYGNQFKPQENITAISLLKALLLIKNGSMENILQEADILKQARELGWIKEEISPSQPVSKEMFSKIIIRYLGLEKIAEISNIYTSKYNDIQSLPQISQGYISLATGLGIVQAEGENFNPDKAFTRAETAWSIIKTLGFGFRN